MQIILSIEEVKTIVQKHFNLNEIDFELIVRSNTSAVSSVDVYLNTQFASILNRYNSNTSDNSNSHKTVQEVIHEKPWYPDDSGEWVEVKDGECPSDLEDYDLVGVLFSNERDTKDWHSEYRTADRWYWGPIVTYKKVK